MSNADVDTAPANPEDQGRIEELDAATKRRNLTWLVALLVVIVAGMFLAYPLFNNMWDPTVSDNFVSH